MGWNLSRIIARARTRILHHPSASPELDAPTRAASTHDIADALKMKDLSTRIAALNQGATESREKTSTSTLRALHVKMSALEQESQETLEQKDTFLTARLHAEFMNNQSPELNPIRTISPGITNQGTANVDERLQELESLYRQGKIGNEEYHANRERILKLIDAR